MTVKELAHLLDSLVLGLEQIKGGATIAKDARVFANAMAPFSSSSIADFSSFLGRCEEYHRTGILPIKQAGGKAKTVKVSDHNLIANEVTRFKNVLDDINTGQVTELRIQSLIKEFGKHTKHSFSLGNSAEGN